MPSDMEVTPEDREQLVDMKFAQMLQKHEVATKADIKDAINEIINERRGRRQQAPQATRTYEGEQQQEQQPERRQSLLDMCFRQALNL